MSGNRDHDASRRYHEATRHSRESVRASSHGLDWSNKPEPFKIYPDLPVTPLPRDFPVPTMDALAAISGEVDAAAPLDLERLAALLFYSAGVTRRQMYPGGGVMYFRAAPSTGSLFHTEVYVVAGGVTGLAAGVYHFSPGDFALRQLRAGDFRGALAIVALPARAVAGFVDLEVNGLLAVDPEKEGALLLAPVGGPAGFAPSPPVIATIAPPVIPLSESEVDYPLLRDAYANSALDSEAEVMAWREAAWRSARPPAGVLVPLPTPRPSAGRPLADTILARGSTREFSGAAIGAEELSTALWHATRGGQADVPSGLVDLYLTVHAVEGIEPGAYAYHPAAHTLELLKRGDFRQEAAYLCLEQALGGMSSSTVFFLADLDALLETYGNRGYRLANLEAGLIGGRLYLGAYAQRFGATGLTFYDRDVIAFFSPHAAGREAIFVTALGRSVKTSAHALLLNPSPPSGERAG